MTENQTQIIYIDGKYCPYHQAQVSIENRGLLFGHGVYEVMRLIGGQIFQFDAHMQRLKKSLAYVGLVLEEPTWIIEKVTKQLLEKNKGSGSDATVYWQFSAGDAGLRACGYRGMRRSVEPLAGPARERLRTGV